MTYHIQGRREIVDHIAARSRTRQTSLARLPLRRTDGRVRSFHVPRLETWNPSSVPPEFCRHLYEGHVPDLDPRSSPPAAKQNTFKSNRSSLSSQSCSKPLVPTKMDLCKPILDVSIVSVAGPRDRIRRSTYHQVWAISRHVRVDRLQSLGVDQSVRLGDVLGRNSWRPQTGEPLSLDPATFRPRRSPQLTKQFRPMPKVRRSSRRREMDCY